MKMYNIKLEELSASTDLKSWQGCPLRDNLYQLNLNYNICLIDMGPSSVDWDQLNIVDTTTAINNSDIDIVFFLMSDHKYNYPPANLESNLYKIMTAINKPIIYIVYDYIKDPQVHYQIKYPIWSTLCATYKNYNNTINYYSAYSDIEITTIHKKYLYSSLSNIIYGYRLVNLVEFQQSEYYNKSLVLVNAPNNVKSDKIFWEWEMQLQWPTYAAAFRQILPTLPINTATCDNDIKLANGQISNTVVFDYSNAAYSNSYVNIIVESTYEYIFFSEKTFKPMLANQFFVIIAGKGSIAMLREMGIDTYDDIIDHSRYDNSNDNTRIQDVHALLHDMQYYDWEQIYKDTVERRKRNRQLLLDLTFEKKFLLELEQMITTITKPT